MINKNQDWEGIIDSNASEFNEASVVPYAIAWILISALPLAIIILILSTL